ncbi:MAG: aldo/keto reductase [Proteobacteria bacterium]|nr:aldo/keto reductase [Pseudomonadota bacterium]
MKHVRFGKTELALSRLGMGCHSLGTAHRAVGWDPFHPDGMRAARRTVRAALDAGINVFDTSPDYGDGLSERILGQALAGCRERVVLASKVDYGPSTTAADVERSVLASLGRLRTDYLDIVQFHGGNYSAAALRRIVHGGLLDTLCRLRQQGRVRHLGLTVLDAITARELIERSELSVAQLLYHIGEQAAARHALDWCAREDLGVCVMRPLTAGAFQQMMSGLVPARLTAAELNELCLEFVLSDPRVHVVHAGMRWEHEVQTNAEVVDRFRPALDVSTLPRSVGQRARQEDRDGTGPRHSVRSDARAAVAGTRR